ncbi:hypothetical protein AB6802_08005 [Mesorhizobium sp. RCC_202]|uniref:hypothetical protein n=1 Tax=Mesorhizobium sp. RCC_202 TaxID=3239222 RepID=UPI001DC700E3|nr:hypothetical protein [Mesorhizobium sp.]
MRRDAVHIVWDCWDGVRTGIADLNGSPHYFASQFDHEADEWPDNFKLIPVGPEFMRRAKRNWSIYRAWERKYRAGEADLKSHPGHGGVDAEHDELNAWLDEQIAQLLALPSLYRAEFRRMPGQEDLAASLVREWEVVWSPLSAQAD